MPNREAGISDTGTSDARGPRVSVVIVNYNGKERVLRCVSSVLSEAGPELECLVVDNGSTDGSVAALEAVSQQDARVRIIVLGANRGPAFARNRGIEVSRGAYLAFLDNDTVVNPGWLEEPVRRMEADGSIGACQCKLVWLADPSLIDYVGDYLGTFGFLVQRAESLSLDEGQWSEEVEIFTAKSAGMVARREAVCAAGLFDEDYFIYVEETDLDWRIWLAGYRVVFVPGSVVKHEYSSSMSILGRKKQARLLKFHGSKNYVLTLLKNLGWQRLLIHLPLHIGLWLGFAAYEGCRGQFSNARWILAGLGWNVLHLPGTLSKRRAVQASRRVSDRELWPRIYRRIGLATYMRRLGRSKEHMLQQPGGTVGHRG